MNSWKKRILSALLLVCFGVFILLKCDRGTGWVLSKESGEEDELILYDRWGRIVDKDFYDERTWIHYITDEIVEIGHSCGSPCRYVYYYNVKTAELTEPPAFFNSILIDCQYVAYWDYDKEVLVITDIYRKGLYYKEIQRDFSPTPNPTGLFRRFELTEDEENFIVEYSSGKDYEKVEEIIPLRD